MANKTLDLSLFNSAERSVPLVLHLGVFDGLHVDSCGEKLIFNALWGFLGSQVSDKFININQTR